MPPVATTRQSPVGIRLETGHPTKVTFAADPDVSLWEMATTPPGIDGGDPIDTTTFFNVTYRTQAPRRLKQMTETSFTAAYDPAVLTQVVALVNVETTITITFMDGSTWAAFGWLQTFEPQEATEDEMPTADCTIAFGNANPTTGAEDGPVVVSVANT